MAYIGKEPADAFTSFVKQDFTTSATTSYTLDHSVVNENELALFINFVRQEPTTAYTASGTTLTLTSATASTDDMYCVFLGKAIQTVNPPSGSVGTAQLAGDSVTEAKIADSAVESEHLNNNIISGQTALGATPADTDELLISDAGTLKRVDYSYLKSANTPAFFGYLSADQSISDQVWTKVEIDTEEFDTDSDYDNSTNYRFTPTTSGKYFFYASSCLRSTTNATLKSGRLAFYKNGSALYGGVGELTTNYGVSQQVTITASFEMNGSSDYVELYGLVDHVGGASKFESDYSGSNRSTFFGGYKIIE